MSKAGNDLLLSWANAKSLEKMILKYLNEHGSSGKTAPGNREGRRTGTPASVSRGLCPFNLWTACQDPVCPGQP
jgi:hypothetical protein